MKNVHLIPTDNPSRCCTITITDEKGKPLTYWGGLKEPKQETTMKEKLELKHLSAYLAYGLKGAAYSIDGYYEPIELGELMRIETGITRSGDTGEVWLVLDDIEVPIIEFKPILRPLSDLTKEIEVNGERFYPLEKLTKIFGGRPISFDGNCFYTKIQKSVVREKEDLVPLHFSQLDAFNKLFEWHFDVFGLIENNLAIDINTLNKQQ
jgi:hypothetical protein